MNQATALSGPDRASTPSEIFPTSFGSVHWRVPPTFPLPTLISGLLFHRWDWPGLPCPSIASQILPLFSGNHTAYRRQGCRGRLRGSL